MVAVNMYDDRDSYAYVNIFSYLYIFFFFGLRFCEEYGYWCFVANLVIRYHSGVLSSVSATQILGGFLPPTIVVLVMVDTFQASIGVTLHSIRRSYSARVPERVMFVVFQSL